MSGVKGKTGTYKRTAKEKKRLREFLARIRTRYWLGKNLSPETKLKMREAHIGKPNAGYFKKGLVRSNEWKEMMRKKLSGKNNYAWLGNKSLKRTVRSCYKYRQWRSDVFTRDDFTCQNCGKRGGYLEADHIEQFAIIFNRNNLKSIEEALVCEELWNINNGRTLCQKCHKNTETYLRRIILGMTEK